ncbi:cyclase family protein [Fimbriiglobus ruber]|uniref:Metal-dependent hydrolase n=1 Tax=Fimbriiglobus ruber TaxID=1908690 RepID=A0A225DUP7_9BACT|nr:cyclase family protein [Fimbriiglobus ruber]OWK45122.1 Metal-dependent hydrolase [Fimbriiglobus ruber]
MRFIDLSQPVYHDSPNCPAHPPVKSEVIKDHPAHGWRVELMTLASHTGSHVDAPLHKIAGGASLDDIPLEHWAGPAYIADFRGIAPGTKITAEMLAAKLPPELAGQIVLLATGWGDKRAKTDEWLYQSPCLSEDGAAFLVAAGIRGVGIDHYSIGGMTDPTNPRVHTILLGAGVWVVEELRFPPEVFDLPQPVTYMGLPVNFRGHTGAFCRPVLVVG